MANQLPFGDAYIIDTPYIDKLNQQLREDQLTREAAWRKNQQDLRDQFAKNVANIKDADVGEMTQAYLDWKNASQDLQRKPPKNHDEMIKAQMDVSRKLANVFSIINASKREKDTDELIQKDYTAHPNAYIDQTGDLLKARINTPTSQLAAFKLKNEDGTETPYDLSNMETFKYKGNTTKFEPIWKKAQGDFVKGDEETYKTKDGLQTVVGEVRRYNTPQQFYDSLVGQIADSKAPTDFLKTYGNITPEREQQINEQFDVLMSDPAVRKRWGLGATESLSGNPNPSDVERLAMLKTKEWAISHAPKIVNERPYENLDATTKRKEDFTREMTEVRNKNSINRLYIYEGIQSRRPDVINAAVDGFIGDHLNSRNPDTHEVLMDGKTYETITGDTYIPKRSVITIDDDGNYQFGRKDDKGNFINMIPITKNLAKTRLIANLKSGLDGRYNNGETNLPKPKAGKTISRAEFQKMNIQERKKFIDGGGKYQ